MPDRDPIADELLRTGLLCVTYDSELQRQWVQDVNHYLDEPQGEPEYVWRAVADWDPERIRVGMTKDEAIADGKEWYVDVTIERAQIGPWTPVE